jgi:uncharacterized protein YbjT (DUF2867 family)
LRDDVELVQAGAIIALVDASKAAKVRQFIQISAANVALDHTNPFFASKARADAALAASGLGYTILRPGLVIGRNAFGGTEMIRIAASVPGLAIDLAGTKSLQCIAMSDIVFAIANSLGEPERLRGTFDLVETSSSTIGEIVAQHRRWLGFGSGLWKLKIPVALVTLVSWFADGLGWLGWRSPLRSSAVAALTSGISGNAAETADILGRPALTLPQIFAALSRAGKADRWHGRLAMAYPLGLVSLILLWLGSGVIGIWQLNRAAQMLLPAGITETAATSLVLGGSIADCLIGVALAFRPTARLALIGTIVLTLAYLGGSLLFRPDLWFDPLAPMLKTLPAMMLSVFCLGMISER